MTYIVKNEYGAFCSVCQSHLSIEEEDWDTCDACGGEGIGGDTEEDDYELLNPPMENSGETGNARAAPAMTGSLPVAGAPTNSGEAVAAELYRFAAKQLD